MALTDIRLTERNQIQISAYVYVEFRIVWGPTASRTRKLWHLQSWKELGRSFSSDENILQLGWFLGLAKHQSTCFISGHFMACSFCLSKFWTSRSSLQLWAQNVLVEKKKKGGKPVAIPWSSSPQAKIFFLLFFFNMYLGTQSLSCSTWTL